MTALRTTTYYMDDLGDLIFHRQGDIITLGTTSGDEVIALELTAEIAGEIADLLRESLDNIKPALMVGLCGNRQDHEPHKVLWAAVVDGPMWCHADQSKRLPHALERKEE